MDLAMLAGFGGTTSEVFYGLERTANQKWIIYLVTLIETHFIPLLDQSNSLISRLPKQFRKLVQILDVIVKLAYITGDCKSFSFLHLISGIQYRYSAFDVYERNDLSANLVKIFLIGGQLTIYLVQSGIFYKMQNRLFSNRHTIKFSASTPFPPDISSLTPKPHLHGHPAPQRAGICPICLDPWTEPIILDSGYIYCKKCLRTELLECPVTKITVSTYTPLYLS
jgi:hypothetical protein